MTSLPRLLRARRLLATSAWLMVVWVAVGYVSTIPAVDRFLSATEHTSKGAALEQVGLSLLVLTGLVMWGAAVRHAWLKQQDRAHARFVWLITLLVVGSFVASFFYYFAWVMWRPDNAEARS
jgi:hypothetical protein